MHFSAWVSQVRGVNTHQFNALVVNHDCGNDGPFVDVFGIDNFLPPLPVQHDSNSVFIVTFSCTHEYVFFGVSPKFLTCQALHISLINIASHLWPSSSHTISSILSLECIDLMFFL